MNSGSSERLSTAWDSRSSGGIRFLPTQRHAHYVNSDDYRAALKSVRKADGLAGTFIAAALRRIHRFRLIAFCCIVFQCESPYLNG